MLTTDSWLLIYKYYFLFNVKFLTFCVLILIHVVFVFFLLLRVVDNWFSPQITGWGFDAFVPLSNLRDTSKGLVVHDMLIVQVEMEAISSTKYSV